MRRLHDLAQLGEAPLAQPAAGEVARSRARRRRTPRERRIARFSCTAGCSNMLTFIAGATTHRRARREVEGAEGVVRDAARELPEDVGRGGRDEQQVRLVRDRRCADVAARARAPTGRGTPGAARGPRTSSGSTKRVAAAVITTRTSTSRRCSSRRISQAL